MGDQNHRAPGQQPRRQIAQAQPGGRIKGAEGFVHQHHRAILDQGAHQGDALAHAARQRGRAGAGAAGQSRLAQQSERPGADGRRNAAAQAIADQDVIKNA